MTLNPAARTSSKDSLFSITSDAPCSEIFNIGDRCRVDENRVGTVAFVGRTNFALGDWVGLVLEKPLGKNSGSVNGVQYFECAEKHGVFCRPSKLKKLASAFSPSSGAFSVASPALSVANSVASTTVATNKLRSIYAQECGFDIGERVTIPGGKNGVVKFLDRINNELFVGVQLDRPLGTCDGTYNGTRYFKCNPLYGTFVLASRTKKSAAWKPPRMEVRSTKSSALRTWKGSQESLNSAGVASSVCSSRAATHMSPMFGKRVPGTATVGTAKDSELFASLKNCLQEKEAHLERLMMEKDQMVPVERYTALEARMKELLTLETEKTAIESKALDYENRMEELGFLLDEAEVKGQALEADLAEAKEKLAQLEDKNNILTFDDSELPAPLPLAQQKRCISEAEAQTDPVEPLKPILESESVEKCDGETQYSFVMPTFDVECQAEEVAHSKPQKHDVECQANDHRTPVVGERSSQTDAALIKYADGAAQTDSPSLDVKPLMSIAESQTSAVVYVDSVAQCVQLVYVEASMQTNGGETRESHAQCVIRVSTAEHHSQTLPMAAVVDASSQSELEEEPKRSFEDRASDAYCIESETRAVDSQTLTVLSAHATTQCEPLAATVVDRASDAYHVDAVAATIQCRIEPDKRSVDSQTVALMVLTADAIAQCEWPTASMIESAVQTAATSEAHYVDNVAQTDQLLKACEMHCQTSPASGSKYVDSTVQCMLTDGNKSTGSDDDALFVKPKLPTFLKAPSAGSRKASNTSGSGRNSPADKTASNHVIELDVAQLGRLSNGNSTNVNGEQHWEHKYKEQAEQLVKLDSTVSFLNSIISDQMATINRLKSELVDRAASDDADSTASHCTDALNGERKMKLRDYCDVCEVFDVHDTRDCPVEARYRAELTAHNTLSPGSSSKNSSGAYDNNMQKPKGKLTAVSTGSGRAFCDHCDAFVHDTSDCPEHRQLRESKA